MIVKGIPYRSPFYASRDTDQEDQMRNPRLIRPVKEPQGEHIESLRFFSGIIFIIVENSIYLSYQSIKTKGMIGKVIKSIENEGFYTIQFINKSNFRLLVNEREINLN